MSFTYYDIVRRRQSIQYISYLSIVTLFPYITEILMIFLSSLRTLYILNQNNINTLGNWIIRKFMFVFMFCNGNGQSKLSEFFVLSENSKYIHYFIWFSRSIYIMNFLPKINHCHLILVKEWEKRTYGYFSFSLFSIFYS